jgi:hypothetical protein
MRIYTVRKIYTVELYAGRTTKIENDISILYTERKRMGNSARYTIVIWVHLHAYTRKIQCSIGFNPTQNSTKSFSPFLTM